MTDQPVIHSRLAARISSSQGPGSPVTGLALGSFATTRRMGARLRLRFFCALVLILAACTGDASTEHTVSGDRTGGTPPATDAESGSARSPETATVDPGSTTAGTFLHLNGWM
jgi:hypothetical protein